jgi:hypothetical protein
MARDLFLEEFRRLPARIGGVKGALSIALLFFLAALPAFRFQTAFLDPQILLAYASLAMIFAGPFAAQSFAGASEKPLLDNRGVPACEVVLAKTAASALYGWLAFAIALSLALFTLNATLPRPYWPAATTILPLALLAAGLSSATAALGARVSMAVYTAQAARQVLRMVFLFLVLLIVALPRFLPSSLQAPLQSVLARRNFPITCLSVAAVLALLAACFAIRAVKMLEERREGLSILGDSPD